MKTYISKNFQEISKNTELFYQFQIGHWHELDGMCSERIKNPFHLHNQESSSVERIQR